MESIHPKEPYKDKISYRLRQARRTSRKKRRVTLYPGDVFIRKVDLQDLIFDIQQLEDESYAYRYSRKMI